MPGNILGGPDAYTEVLIFRPPKALIKGPHGACFHPRGGKDKCYRVHFAKQSPGNNPDPQIVAVERLLLDALSPSDN